MWCVTENARLYLALLRGAHDISKQEFYKKEFSVLLLELGV